ncbi:MAG: hypothetical protein SFU84_15230 [Gemmatimonadales bacterium]|nr:hypothetical protein [Gemmatimonadales bacterium]
MKLFLSLPEPLVARLEAEAARLKATMSDVVAEALLRMLDGRRAAPSWYPLPTFELGAPMVDLADRNALYDCFDQED